MNRTICVIGLGYIGLPTAAVLARQGFDVVGLDVDPVLVETVNRGAAHIVEPDLDVAVRDAVASGRLRAVVEAPAAHVFIIAVPTPFKAGKQPDLGFVEAAARVIAPRLTPGNLVIIESTSPVGTTDKVAQWLAAARPDLAIAGQREGCPDVHLAYCPERVLPGNILRELVENDRIIGGLTPACAALARDFYESFVRGNCVTTTARTAELCKLTENSFRDVNIAFANEVSLVCARLGIDVWELVALANRHPRVNILQPGPGVGGHCIAVDPWFIVSSTPDEARLIRTAREVNDAKPEWVVAQIAAALDDAPNSRVACFGLSFKRDIDDLRESPAVEIVARLAERFSGRVLVVEPYIDTLPERLASQGVRLVSADEAIAQAAIVALLVDHSQFQGLTSRVADKRLFDTRGQWVRSTATNAAMLAPAARA